MTTVLLITAVVLTATFALAAIRIVRGPGRADRMLAAQLLGTTGTALLLVAGQLQPASAVLDVALLIALVAVLGVVAFVRRTTVRPTKPEAG